MPIYEFTCLDCGKRFKEVKPIAEYDPRAVECPKCHARNVERRWSSVFVETSKKS
jgi:putative FmdB family regulatory protein